MKLPENNQRCSGGGGGNRVPRLILLRHAHRVERDASKSDPQIALCYKPMRERIARFASGSYTGVSSDDSDNTLTRWPSLSLCRRTSVPLQKRTASRNPAVPICVKVTSCTCDDKHAVC